MDTGTLIDAIVRQTTVLIAQLATAGGSRAQLAHTANQVFLDLVHALRERGLGSKVIADMFGMALRTYHQRVQRLGESRTERGRTLWEAVFDHIQGSGPVTRHEVLNRFRHDDEVVVRSLLKDLVDSGLVYRSGRGDFVRYHVVSTDEAIASDAEQSLLDLICLTAHRLSPATADDISGTLSIDPGRVHSLLARLEAQGRVRALEGRTGEPPRYTSSGCVIPLGVAHGWEVAVFDHYQAVVSAICTKLRLGQNRAQAADLVGGSTFSYTVWEGHPHYQEATEFLAQFRARGAALREKITRYNAAGAGGVASDPNGSAEPSIRRAIKVLIYGGQTLHHLDDEFGPNPDDETQDEEFHATHPA